MTSDPQPPPSDSKPTLLLVDDDDTFRELERRAGPFHCDLFANDDNARNASFFSIVASNKSMAKDAFLQDWKDVEPCFACPPPRLIGATLRHFVGTEAAGGLIAPLWVTSPAWPLLCEDGVHLNRLVQSVGIVHPFITKGNAVISDTFHGYTKFPFLSMKIHGGVPFPFKSRVHRDFCTKNGCSKCC